MQAPPVLVNFPGSNGAGPIARDWWTKFCDLGTAQALLADVKALGSTDAQVIDATQPGGDYSAFAGYFTYLDEATRMWQIKGTLNTGTQNEVMIDELAGPLALRKGKTIYPDKGGNSLVPTVVALGVVQLSWGAKQ